MKHKYPKGTTLIYKAEDGSLNYQYLIFIVEVNSKGYTYKFTGFGDLLVVNTNSGEFSECYVPLSVKNNKLIRLFYL